MSTFLSIRRLAALGAVAATLATGTVALADSDSDEMPQQMLQGMPFGFGPFGGGMGMMARPVDTNGDGLVTATEASQHASVGFAVLDLDGDDAVTEDEFMDSAPSAMPMGRRNTERLYVNRTARFKAMDSDADGTVTRAEFISRAQASFEAADADGDGKVTVWEFRSQQNPF
ncbi:MAG: hypothetical protein WBN04_08085 [Paracoccaceae bacterium]